ncbi:MAG: SEC-C domain-containing protein [Gemmataceae bacterium]|nr:SEC-C domain-containing protein [Gemmataceae bacterium]
MEHSEGWSLSMHGFQRALAETHFELDPVKGEELFQQWLEREPRVGWGWISWSDRYRYFGSKSADDARAEQILLRGLEVPDVDDREFLLERLYDLYVETGRKHEAKAAHGQLKELRKPKGTTRVTRTDDALQMKQTFDFGERGLPLEQFTRFAESRLGGQPQPARRTERVGRNDPCPCGSGKKFKRCCGGR